MSTDNVPWSTAEILGGFRKELTKQGFEPDIANDLVRQAAHQIISNDELVVKR